MLIITQSEREASVRIVAILAVVSALGACAATPEQIADNNRREAVFRAEVDRLNAALTDGDRAECNYQAHAGAMNARGGFLYQIAEENNLRGMCLEAKARMNLSRKESASTR